MPQQMPQQMPQVQQIPFQPQQAPFSPQDAPPQPIMLAQQPESFTPPPGGFVMGEPPQSDTMRAPPAQPSSPVRAAPPPAQPMSIPMNLTIPMNGSPPPQFMQVAPRSPQEPFTIPSGPPSGGGMLVPVFQ
eukprot:CAMPEP_0181309696 /NCGR_PEP_ID=MMETSP1101-20121128/12156_1 /TAXON_ID=46948 /ORGANISM="Rhodomonas abbreviata, Strain Caron Lab Isolate" /LENGTH=130 /DNA_ID=CAMNT_0023416207 /DNA_START=3 /DNA_END=392 /DNA_ORIENTATION=-